MDWIYNFAFGRLTAWIMGTDGQQRIRTFLVGIVTSFLAKVLTGPALDGISHIGITIPATNDIANWLANAILAGTGYLITHYTIRKPAVPDLPPAPPTAEGVPDLPPVPPV